MKMTIDLHRLSVKCKKWINYIKLVYYLRKSMNNGEIDVNIRA